MPDRMPCVVPFCRRTAARVEFAEWICGKHWSATSRSWRRRLFLFRRRGRLDLADRMWDRLKRQAIETAAGVS
jgi:hypothetical protein